MMRAAELPVWLEACAAPASRVNCVLVIGGGGFADEVRALQQRWRYSDSLAHALAIEAMTLNARVVHSLQPELALFSAAKPRADAIPAGPCCLWLPSDGGAGLALPHSWDISADSIACRIGAMLGAQRVLLVKSLPPASLRDTDAQALAVRGVIDVGVAVEIATAGVAVNLLSKSDHARFGAACLAGEWSGADLSTGEKHAPS